jgi:flagellar basal-body rod modification protein FlgD
MSTTIPGFTPTTAGSSTTNPSGISGMTGADFMKVMIAQLQHQDPLDPSKSDQLLTQMSQISQLQSNQAMQTNIEGLTLQQSIGAGGNLIGKTVVGLDETGAQVTGVVTSIKVENKQVSLELDSGKALPLSSVTQIAPTSTQSTAMQSVLASPQVQGLLTSMGISGSQLTQAQLAQIVSSPQAQAYFANTAQQTSGSTSGGTSGNSVSSLLSMLGF